jgi:hypothetical protein
MINASMDYNVPFFINGASTDELISQTVPMNYTRYKYLFRDNPINSTCLFKTICAFLGGYLIPKVMLPLYGTYLWPGAPVKQVRVAVVTEQLEWTNVMHYLLTLPPGVDPRYPAGYQTFLGPNANLTYQARLSPTASQPTIAGVLTGVIGSAARVLIHVFSAPIGVQFIGTWAAMGVQALPAGINVMDQLDSTWNSTGGGCQYECMLDFAGTRTPITPQTQIFWDHFVARTGRWPIYTAYGAYDALYGLKEILENPANTAAVLAYLNDPGPPPYATSAALIPGIEATDRQGLTGRFRYTPQHDIYLTTADVLSQYYTGNVRAMMVQWTGATWPTARKEVVWPIMHSSIPYPLPYARMVRLPPVMYPLMTDINYDGKVDGKDIAMAASAFGSQPGDPRWKMEADLDNNGKIDGKDIAKIAKDFGKRVTLPLP